MHQAGHRGGGDRGAAARVQREGAMHGDEEHQRREQADQVVVVQVVGGVDDLQVREHQEQEGDRGAEPEPHGDQRAQHRQRREQRVGHRGRRRRHPAEAPVGEAELRHHEHVVDPAVGEEAQRRRDDDQAEGDAERGERRDVAGRDQRGPGPVPACA